MESVQAFLVKYPELTLFATIGLGYWLGGFRYGTFKLGPVTGSLFAGILIGQFADVPISGMTKSFLFLLFLFGVGYSVGPQFLPSLRRDGVKPALVAVVVCVTGLATAIAVAKLLGLDPGFAGGLLSGSLKARRWERPQRRSVRLRFLLTSARGSWRTSASQTHFVICSARPA
jgi:putative transport protein